MVKTRVTLSFDVESARPLTRQLLRDVKKRLLTRTSEGAYAADAGLWPIINEFYAQQKREDIDYVALEQGDSRRIALVKVRG